MKKNILLILGLLSTLLVRAQELPNRYIDEITQDLKVTKDLVFSTDIPTVQVTNLFGFKFANENTYGNKQITLKMDIYEPENDDLTQRPVIIFAFGGGFVTGERDEKSMIKLCESFARRGFVTATIDYRLGMHIGDEELAKRAVYQAMQDGRSAVRFFRKNASNYKIDPNQVYISGHSAGGFLAYHVAYLDKESERPASTREYFGRDDLGTLDGIGDNKSFDGKPNGFMGLSGALGSLGDIEDPDDIPGLYFHSSDDNIVLFDTGEPFTFLSWIPGVEITVVSGGNQMDIRANSVNAPHKFYPYTNRGHQVHFDGDELYPDIASNGARYFYENFLKPNPTTIQGNPAVCSECTSQTYTASNNQASYYDWEIEGGVFVSRNPSSNTVQVRWNANASSRNLTVTPYSNYLARGKSASLFAKNDNCSWQQTSGLGGDIGAGAGEVYVIGTTEEVHRRVNNGWVKMGGIDAERIDVQEGGHPWAVATNGRIYRNINNQGWDRMRDRAEDIGISGNHIYVVKRNNRVYKLNSNERWDEVRRIKAIRVDASANGDAWIVGEDNFVYQSTNGEWSDKIGTFRASDITVSENSNAVWALELNTGIPHLYKGNGLWESYSGVLTNITANSNGELWGTVSSNNGIYKNSCFATETTNRTNSETKNTTKPIEASLNQKLDLTVSVYPNPVRDRLTVALENYEGSNVRAILTNLSGQKVYAGTIENSDKNALSLDVSNLNQGIYILSIYAEGHSPITKRILIK